MTHPVLRIGPRIGTEVSDSSANGTGLVQNLKTLGDLLHILGENIPSLISYVANYLRPIRRLPR